MFDRNTLIALVVVGLILITMPAYYKWISPPKPAAPAVTDSVTVRIDTVQAKRPEASPKTEPAAVAAAAPTVADTAVLDPNFVEVETPRFKLTFASNAQVSSYRMKDYHDAEGRDVALHVGGEREVGLFDVDLGNYNPASLKNLRFERSAPRMFIPSGTDSVIFTRVDSAGRTITLTYVFEADKFGFTVVLNTQGLAKPDNGEFSVKWLGGVPVTEPDTLRELTFSGAYAKVGEELEKIQLGTKPVASFDATGQTHFAAVRSKYFIAAVVPQKLATGVDIKGRNPNPADKHSPHYFDISLRQTWLDNASGRYRVYWGPLHLKELEAEHSGIEETMNWGWAIVKPFSKLALWGLTALHKVISNYGIVIIIFAIIVKVVLWPLTRKSQVSMRKMSALQPQMQAIRELHKNNPQAMNAAVMKLYKDNGVNPASGCIPVLLQMPVMIGLYQVFASTIEFRQQPFTAWITDLSRPDVLVHLPFSIPLYGAGVALLPLVMGLTQFFMSKATVTDPNQKAMLYIMPPMMTVMFNGFPSGLTLYYTLFNLFAIVEQKLIKLPDFTPSATVVEEPKKKAKK